MNENNNVLIGLKHNSYYFYSITTIILLQILNNIISIPYLDEAKTLSNNLTKTISDQGKDVNNFQNIITEASNQSIMLAQKYATIAFITNLISTISFVLLIIAIIYLAKTVSNYYGHYHSTKDDKTLVTTSGAVWGWFIPILNFVRPFNTTNEVLNGSNSNPKDTEVSTAQYAFWTSISISIINTLLSSLTPTILYVFIGAISSLLFIYSSYLMFNIHKRIFELQK